VIDKGLGAGFIKDLDLLETEIDTVYWRIVKPAWDVDTHRYPNTLYGFVMDCFAALDVVSRHWEGKDRPRTPRMRDFMDKYVAPDREANDVAIQMWRHTLMHTGKPRDLLDSRTGIRYRWLLHWSTEQLPRSQHMQLQLPDPKMRILNLALTELVKDLRTGFNAYIAELRTETVLQQNFFLTQSEVELQPFETRR